MKYLDYLNQMFSDIHEVADYGNYKKYNNNLDISVAGFNNGDKVEFISSGRYVTIRFTEKTRNNEYYSVVFIFRSIRGIYGLLKTYVALKENEFYCVHDYRPEYTLLEAHNIVAKYNKDIEGDYHHVLWDNWFDYYNKIVDSCPTVGIAFPNSPDAFEVLCL